MITMVIPTRNDPELQATVDSIRNGAKKIDIVVVDDASMVPVDIAKCRVIRNNDRIGPALSRSVGARESNTDWLCFCDSHMRFPEDWYGKAMMHLYDSDQNEVWGTNYVRDHNDNSFWHDTRLVGGADFYWWKHHGLRYSFADLSPRRVQQKVQYDVPCLLGGCYFIHKSFFRRIGGFGYMVGYGSEEAWLSWNAWLSGGYVRIMGNLDVTHILAKGHVAKRAMLPEWEHNRLVVLKRVLSDEEYKLFCSWLPISDVSKLMVDNMCSFDKSEDKLHHDYVTGAFGIQRFQEAIRLMEEFHSSIKELCPVCKNRRWLIGPRGMHPCPVCNCDAMLDAKVGHYELLPNPSV